MWLEDVHVDGSWMGSSLLGGVGVYFGWGDVRNRAHSLRNVRSSLGAELTAILQALKALRGVPSGGEVTLVRLHTDCRQAIRCLNGASAPADKHAGLVAELRTRIRQLFCAGVRVSVLWASRRSRGIKVAHCMARAAAGRMH